MSNDLMPLLRQTKKNKDRLERLDRIDVLDTDSGTWTPVFTGTTIAGTFTYTANRAGIWRRVGDLIYIEARIAISAISVAPTGTLRVTGLPYTASSTPPSMSLAIGQMSQFNISANVVQLVARIEPGDTFITLSETFDNLAAADYPAANFTNASANLILSGWYRTDS